LEGKRKRKVNGFDSAIGCIRGLADIASREEYIFDERDLNFLGLI